jgi:hypothetical protein
MARPLSASTTRPRTWPVPFTEPGLPHHLQFVALAGVQALEQEGPVGAGGLLGAVRARAHGHAAALTGGPRGDEPAGGAVAAFVAQDAADSGSGPERELDRLAGAGLREVHRVDARAREARAPGHERVLPRLQATELEAAVGPGLAPQLVAGADQLHLHAAAAGANLPRGREAHLAPGERPALLVLHHALHREAAAHDHGEPGACDAGREREAAHGPLLVVVVAHVEPLVVARGEPRGPKRAVAAGPHGLLLFHAAHEHAQHALAAARDAHARALDRGAVLVQHAAHERRGARERDVLRLGLAGGDAHAPRPRHEAVVLGAQPVAAGPEAPERVAPVRERAGLEHRALAARREADPREGLPAVGFDHAPGERRGRGERDRDRLVRPRREHRRGAPALACVGHERPRLAGRAVEQEAAVGSRLDPARGLRASLEAHQRAPGRRALVGERHRAAQRMAQHEHERTRERSRAHGLPFERRERGSLDAQPVRLARRRLEAERAVRLDGRRQGRAAPRRGVLRPPLASGPQRHRRADHGPATLVHDAARQSRRLRQAHVTRVVCGRVEERLQDARRRRSTRESEADAGPRRGGDAGGEAAVRPAGGDGERLRRSLAPGLAAGLREAVLEGQHRDGHPGRWLAVDEDPAADLAGLGRDGGRGEGHRARERAEGHAGSPVEARYAGHRTKLAREKSQPVSSSTRARR